MKLGGKTNERNEIFTYPTMAPHSRHVKDCGYYYMKKIQREDKNPRLDLFYTKATNYI